MRPWGFKRSNIEIGTFKLERLGAGSRLLGCLGGSGPTMTGLHVHSENADDNEEMMRRVYLYES